VKVDVSKFNSVVVVEEYRKVEKGQLHKRDERVSRRVWCAGGTQKEWIG
jgi:hypothetical protein